MHWALPNASRRGRAGRLGVATTALLLVLAAIPGTAAVSAAPAAPPAPVGLPLADTAPCGLTPLDVEIIIDTSGSMNTDPNGSGASRLAWAKQAATQLVNNLQTNGGVGTGPATSTGGRHRVGVTQFSGNAGVVVSALASQNAAGTNTAINGLAAGGVTPLKAGMAVGAGDMTANDRTTDFGLSVVQIIVLLSDGSPNPNEDPPYNTPPWADTNATQRPTLANATAFLGSADQVFSIAIGAGGSGTGAVDLPLMAGLAKPSDPNHAAHVVNAADLPNLFNGIFQAIGCPSISVAKTNNAPPAGVAQGGSVNYTLTLTVLNGFIDATIVDQLPTGIGNATAISDGGTYDAGTNRITWVVTSVTNGKQLTYTAAVGANAELGAHTNTATITAGECGNTCSAQSTVTVIAAAAPTLALTKSVSSTSDATGATAKPGDTLSYKIHLANTGNANATGVAVSDNLGTIVPTFGAYQNDCSNSCTGTTTLSWTGLTVNAGSTLDLTFTIKLNNSFPSGTTPLHNTAISAQSTNCLAAAPAAACTTNTTVTAVPALSITKDATTANYNAVGQTINYNIVATNTGNVALAAVTVTDANAVLGTCTPANGSPLAPGATMTCPATHTVTQADIDAGHYLNTACVDDGAAGAAQACDDADVPAVNTPHLSIEKTATEANYDSVGDVLNYTIVATNDGNSTLAAVTVTDPNASGLSCTPANGSPLAPGASMNCTASHTITQADIDAGHYLNTACVDDGAAGAAQACDDVTVTRGGGGGGGDTSPPTPPPTDSLEPGPSSSSNGFALLMLVLEPCVARSDRLRVNAPEAALDSSAERPI